MESLQFWLITTSFLILIGLVGFFYRRSLTAEASVMKVTADGIRKSVDELTGTIKEHTIESRRLFDVANGEIAGVKTRVTKLETRCNLYHGE